MLCNRIELLTAGYESAILPLELTERLNTYMFVHDNGKIAVLANSRCGHQSMYEYFNIPIEVELRDKTHQWISSNNRKVLVLRNPIERMWSGLGLFDLYAKPVIMMYDAAKAKGVDKKDSMSQFKFASLFVDETTRHNKVQEIIFKGHCAPYLHSVETVDYEIIDFNKLNEYIPLAHRTNVTNCNNNSLDNFVENDIFTKEDMKKEYDLYLSILNSRPQISPNDWKSLTILD